MNDHTRKFFNSDLYDAIKNLWFSLDAGCGEDEDVIEIERLLAEDRQKVVGETVEKCMTAVQRVLGPTFPALAAFQMLAAMAEIAAENRKEKS